MDNERDALNRMSPDEPEIEAHMKGGEVEELDEEDTSYDLWDELAGD